ncbi:MAG: hypothetical protein ACI3U2_08035 [Anaerovibrio sp.]
MISPVFSDYKRDMAIARKGNRIYSKKAARLFRRARMLGKAYKIVRAKALKVYRSGSHEDCNEIISILPELSLQVAVLRSEARELLKEGEKEINTVKFEYSNC